MAFWDSPSSSSSSLNLDLEGIPVSMLEEHAKVLEEDLATMTFDEQAAARREIAQVRWQISQLNQQQPKPPKQYPNDNLNIGIMNPGFDFNSATPLDSEHSYGNTSNNEDSLFFYNGAGMSGNMNGSGILNRKRQRESLGTEDDTEFDTKSPRFTPSPRNFASSPSPARNGYMQNDNDAEMARLLMLNTPGSQQQQLLLDEEYARHLQEQFNNGYSPPSHPFQRTGSLIDASSMRPPEVPSPSLRQQDIRPFRGSVIELSDDDEELNDSGNFLSATPFNGGMAMDGQHQETLNVKSEHTNDFDYPNGNFWASTWIDMPVGNPSGTTGTTNKIFEEDSFLGSTDSQIVDPAGNVLLNGGWVPGMPEGRLNGLSSEVKTYAHYVSNDPTKTLEEIKSLLENIRPDMEIPPENREGTPDALVYPLMEHQKVGLTWLKKMEESKTKGGILADDMGLGKTIQTLALLVSRPSQNEKCKTTLIIAPVALLKQWEREIRKKLKPEHKLSVHIHHGGGKKVKNFSDLAAYDVVMTTFGTIASEYKRKESYDNTPEESRGAKPKLLLLGEDARFYRVVIDEAQYIKNKDTQSSKGCYSLHAQYRLCLSGTPMQNSCDELFSLLRFLRIKPYNEWAQFSQTFSRPLKQKSQFAADQAMNKLQALLKAILLRRTKSSEIDGQPILTLPPKEVTMVHAVFSPDEQAFYDGLESKSKIVFNKYLRQNAVGRNYSNLLVLLLRLRQACCHPHLINDLEEAKEENDQEAMLALVNDLSPDAVVRIKQSESLECPVCLDVSENPSIVIPCGHLFCKECLLQVQTQHEQSNLERGEEHSKLRCPGCRGELNPKRVTDLSSFKRIYPPGDQEVDKVDDLAIERNDDLIYDTDSDSEDEETENGDLANFVVPDGAGDDYVPPKDDKSNKAQNKGKSSKEKGKKKAPRGRTLAEVRKDAMRNEKSKRQYHKYLEKRWVDSAKVSKCVEIVEEIQRNDPTEKTIVFSQFTSLLDLLEIPISKAGFSYRRYDGGMSASKRNQSLIDFQDDDNVKILLVSLKAGNSGLNLVAASQVIIFDPFYNPFIEFQAIDRAHRIGQQRRVVVHRLVVAGTVEDRVMELQEMKRKLIEGALDENAQRGLGRLNAKDLGFLFGIGG